MTTGFDRYVSHRMRDPAFAADYADARREIALGDPASCPTKCDVRFLDFAVPVAVGSAAGFGASLIAQAFAKDERTATRATIGAISQAAAFWLVGGFAWVLWTRRPR